MASELPNDGIKCRDTPLRPLRRRRDGDEVCRDNILFKNTPRPPRMDYNAQPPIMEDYFATVLMLSMAYHSYKIDVRRRIFSAQNDNAPQRL